ncbi:MAG: hypothetical protein Q4B91_00730 [Atopobiaceae bacterium]|nr:hypothetical protein [Atopobiaceae bacterium]
MDDGIRTVVGSDGMHQEQESDFVRWDLATGEASLVFGDSGDGVRTASPPSAAAARAASPSFSSRASAFLCCSPSRSCSLPAHDATSSHVLLDARKSPCIGPRGFA